ncbi:MAG: patatin-like phospholipase family protein [Gammaproteobacteria bacterium]|nr:patatin-like phospholipase family protein [Gammaproteobacteria bacterium]
MASLKEWLQEQPFTLTMSSGFFGFFAHAGVLAELLEQGIKPNRITGSSAGALVGATYASGTPIDAILTKLFATSKADFWDPGLGLGLLKGKKFRGILAELVSCQNIEDCPVKLALSVYDGRSRKTEVLSKGNLVDAVYASCAVPFMFQPIWIKRRPLWDGGISDRPGLAGTVLDERVFYHHIASRSPWRSKNSQALQLPERENLAALAIEHLPRSGPNKLNLGKSIYQTARKACKLALDTPMQNQKRHWILSASAS